MLKMETGHSSSVDLLSYPQFRRLWDQSSLRAFEVIQLFRAGGGLQLTKGLGCLGGWVASIVWGTNTHPRTPCQGRFLVQIHPAPCPPCLPADMEIIMLALPGPWSQTCLKKKHHFPFQGRSTPPPPPKILLTSPDTNLGANHPRPLVTDMLQCGSNVNLLHPYRTDSMLDSANPSRDSHMSRGW